MRRTLAALALVLAALLPLASPAAAGLSIPEGTIRGRVFDRTCSGPCYINSERRPFQGEATVEVYRVPGHELYASTDIEKSRFRTLGPPGTYRVRVIPYRKADPTPYPCWQGSTRRVEVVEGEVTRVRLTVENICVAKERARQDSNLRPPPPEGGALSS